MSSQRGAETCLDRRKKELETKEMERGVRDHGGPTATLKRCLRVTPDGSIDFWGIHVPDPIFSF